MLPTHSDFYRSLGIAGFFQEDYRDRPKRSFVFVHPMGAEVRLLSKAKH